MAYQGIQERRFNRYIDKTIAHGWYYQKLHIFTCEKCGAEAAVLHMPSESFYCHGGDSGKYCGALVNIEPAAELASK